jgi:ArsR family transcriptional regulator, nickel/cobalt-responsive transcriptional repressor
MGQADRRGCHAAYERRAKHEHLSGLAYVRMSHGVHGRTSAPKLDAALAADVAERMQALSTPSRVRILAHLKEGPSPVGALAEAVGMEPSAVSHQLRQLRQLRFVVGERRGRQVVYALHDDHVAELLDQVVFHMQHVRLNRRRRQAS